MGELLARATRRSAVAHVRHVSPVAPRAAGGLVAAVYRQVERDFGMLAPPVSLHSPAPEVLAACWLMLRESLIAGHPPAELAQERTPRTAIAVAPGSPGQPGPPDGRAAAAASTGQEAAAAILADGAPAVRALADRKAVDRTRVDGTRVDGTRVDGTRVDGTRVAAATRDAKEAVAAAVSLANRCPYCVEVHGATLIGLVRSPDAVAIAEGRIDSVGDPAMRALARWAHGDAETPPFPARLAPEFVGVAVTFHYLNRMVNLFLQDSLLPPSMPKSARRRINRVAARIMGSLARDTRAPGDSLALLPEAPLPADMAWAMGVPGIAEAFARASAAIERAGERSVPDDVRALVHGWRGEAPGMSTKQWLDDVTGGLSASDRVAGRLAMLTGFASHQVSPALVDEFRRRYPGDGTLIEFAAWVSLTVARRTGASAV